MSEQTIAVRLAALNIALPEASEPAAKYANFVIHNGLMFVSGREFTTEEGYLFARQAGIEVLAVVQSALGSLERVKQVVKVQGFVNADPLFEEHHKVLNGFSDLMLDVFEDKGSHARSVFGAVSVRDNLPIIVDSIFAVEE